MNTDPTYKPGMRVVHIIKTQEPLTKRELEVLKVIEEGLTYEQAAKKLWISFQTVSSHMRSVRAKLRVKNSMAAARKVREQQGFRMQAA